jgi:intracellular sulfur oxidation DsrE/DsrF family protein
MRNRREIIGAIAASGAVLATTGRAGANPVALDIASLKKDTDIACLYHCDFGDPRRFSQMLQNMLNHYSAYDFDNFRLKLVIVAHGAGLKFFLDDLSGTPWEKEAINPDIYKRFVGLTKYGAEAYLCQITYKRLKIDPGKTRKDAFLKYVPSGVATVAELQSKGFGYLKVG